jgi:cation diffusion facilitator CzcD-associated flavoprotein CzcO
MTATDVVIIGAGPYGLSAAAHLLAIKGLAVRVQGEPMSFWEQHMPIGMLLRSPYVASHLSDPEHSLTLDRFQAECGNHLHQPVPLDRFIEYGRWFQRKVAPDVDTRTVVRIEKDSPGLRLTLNDGEIVKTRRAVVATGIGSFAHYPAPLEGLPPALISHASEHRELSCFRDKQVLVIGGGQSALESTALLHECGAEVEVLVREHMIHWIGQWKWMRARPISWLLYAPSEVGPPGVSQLTARPNLYRRMPRAWQDRLAVRSVRPAGARWLKPRLNEVRIQTGCSVASAVPMNGRLRVTLGDGSQRHVDHVLLGTGYRIDLQRCPFLPAELLASIRRIGGYPQLNQGFECSVPGLHFVGAPAAWSFGPLMRFVAGAEFAARALARRILARH